jgi:hypothetical protein
VSTEGVPARWGLDDDYVDPFRLRWFVRGRHVTAGVAASDVPDIAADAAVIGKARDRMRNAAVVNDRR